MHSDQKPAFRCTKPRKASEELDLAHWSLHPLSNFVSRDGSAMCIIPGRHLDTNLEATTQDLEVLLSQGRRRHIWVRPCHIATKTLDRRLYALQRRICVFVLQSRASLSGSRVTGSVWRLRVVRLRPKASPTLELRLRIWLCTLPGRDSDTKIQANRPGSKSRSASEVLVSAHSLSSTVVLRLWSPLYIFPAVHSGQEGMKRITWHPDCRRRGSLLWPLSPLAGWTSTENLVARFCFVPAGLDDNTGVGSC
jgi:hypothetical protein